MFFAYRLYSPHKRHSPKALQLPAVAMVPYTLLEAILNAISSGYLSQSSFRSLQNKSIIIKLLGWLIVYGSFILHASVGCPVILRQHTACIFFVCSRSWVLLCATKNSPIAINPVPPNAMPRSAPDSCDQNLLLLSLSVACILFSESRLKVPCAPIKKCFLPKYTRPLFPIH